MDEDSPKYGSNPYPVQVRVNIFNTFTLRHITISLFRVSNLNYPLTLRTNQMQQGSSLPTQAMFHGGLEMEAAMMDLELVKRSIDEKGILLVSSSNLFS